MIIEWKYHPAGEQSDPSTELWVDGVDTGIAVQHCLYGGGFAVNEIGHDPEWFMAEHGERPTLAEAKLHAFAVYEQRDPVR